jgi:hypothetical protein
MSDMNERRVAAAAPVLAALRTLGATAAPGRSRGGRLWNGVSCSRGVWGVFSGRRSCDCGPVHLSSRLRKSRRISLAPARPSGSTVG